MLIAKPLALTLLMIGVATAQAATAPGVSHADRSFFEKAAKSGMEEVAVSQAAMPNLANAQAKDFANMMVSDHTGANEELKSLAAKKGVTLPAKQPDTKKWASGKKKKADSAYMDKMVKDHEEAVELFTKASQKSDDAEVQAFAAKTLPTLQHHLEQAKSIQQAVK